MGPHVEIEILPFSVIITEIIRKKNQSPTSPNFFLFLILIFNVIKNNNKII